MKRRFFEYGGLAAAVVVAAAFLMTASVEGQNNAAGSTSVSTPRTPDGKPDLTGMWNGNPLNASTTFKPQSVAQCDLTKPGCVVTLQGSGQFKKDESGNLSERFGSRRCGPTQKGTDGKGCYEETNETTDTEFTRRSDPNRPLYKPEYWDKVQDLDYNSNTKDPIFRCLPLGVPRIGAPAQIIQTAKYVIFFYGGITVSSNQFRIIPTDGRGHDPVRAQDISYFGDAVGHWDGATLVVESVGFNDETWLSSGVYGGGGGYFHSYDMKVIERLRREGDTLHYQATVEDPTVLLQPWVMNAKELHLDSDPNAYLQEGDQCYQADPGLFVDRIRH